MRPVPPAGRVFGPVFAKGAMGGAGGMGTLVAVAMIAMLAVAAIAALAVAAGPAGAAEAGDAAGAHGASHRSAWLTACGGRGGVQHESSQSVIDRPAYLAALGVQSGRHLLSARVTTVSSSIRTGDIALLYEHALVNSR